MSIKNKKIKKILPYFAVFFLALIFFGFFQAQNYICDADSFYHARLTQMMSDNNLIVSDFPWMQFSTLKNNFVDHHFLYHLLLLLFVKIFNPLIAVKIATVFLSAILMTVIFGFLKKYKLPFTYFFLLILITAPVFLFRYSMIKANSVSLIILLFIINFLFKKNKLALLILNIIYPLAYGGWLLAPIVAVIFFFSQALHFTYLNKTKFRGWFFNFFSKQNLLMFLSVLGGNFIGIIFSPYFPKNLKFYWQQIVQIGIINYQDTINVGAEWINIDFSNVFAFFGVFSLLIVLAIVSLMLTKKQFNKQTFFWGILTLFLIIISIKSRRYLEYFFPLSIFFVAYAFQYHEQKIKKFLHEKLNWQKSLILFLTIIIIFTGLFNTYSALQNHQLNELEEANLFLQTKTPPNTLVLHSRWDEWPQLFYFNKSHNYFIAGLDPTFSYLYNPDLYLKWEAISKGEDAENMYQIIKEEFQADYVLVTDKFPDFKNNLDNNIYFERMYTDDSATIYSVN